MGLLIRAMVRGVNPRDREREREGGGEREREGASDERERARASIESSARAFMRGVPARGCSAERYGVGEAGGVPGCGVRSWSVRVQAGRKRAWAVVWGLVFDNI